MKGGYCKQGGRNTFRIWFPWKGRKIFVCKYFDGTPLYHESQAQRVLERIRSEVDANTFDPSLWTKDKALQFEACWEVYQSQSPCGEDRHNARDRIFRDFLLPYFEGKSLKEIEEHAIRDWWQGIPKTYAPAYLNQIRATLKAFLTFNRITRVKALAFPTVKVTKKTPAWITEAEQEKILSSMPDRHYPVFKFLVRYGCRVSEAANLRRADIDWVKNEITFRERKNDKENTLPLFEDIKPILRIATVANLEFVFCTQNGRKYNRQILYRLWIEACKKAEAKPIPLKNATRHSLACQLLERGETAMTVARILGNTASMVEHVYGTISVKRIAEAMITMRSPSRIG